MLQLQGWVDVLGQLQLFLRQDSSGANLRISCQEQVGFGFGWVVSEKEASPFVASCSILLAKIRIYRYMVCSCLCRLKNLKNVESTS